MLDKENCKNEAYKNSHGYSIKKALEFKIIDHNDVKVDLDSKEANEELPSVDIEILFDYNSENIGNDQYSKINELASVLKGDKFSKYRFVIIGHTDAKSSAVYNLNLSERRANSVR